MTSKKIMELKAEAEAREMSKWGLCADNYDFSYGVSDYEFNWKLYEEEKVKFLADGNSEEMWNKFTSGTLRADFIMCGLCRQYNSFDDLMLDFINKKGLYDGNLHFINFIKPIHLKFNHSLAEKAANDLMNDGKAVVKVSDTAKFEISIFKETLILDNEKFSTYAERFETESITKEIMIWYYSRISKMYAEF